MNLSVDAAARVATFEVAKKLYSLEALQIAAHIFDSRAQVRATEEGANFEIVLEAKRKNLGKPELEALAGEFLNELLNQEYRFVVAKFNNKISSLIVTQALFAARGGEHPPTPSAEEQTPAFKAEVAALMKETADEIKRVMPKKLPPQGTPIPPLTGARDV